MAVKATEARRRRAEERKAAREALGVTPEDLTTHIKALLRALPESYGTARGTRITEQVRNLQAALRLSQTLTRGHAQTPNPAPPVPGPLE